MEAGKQNMGLINEVKDRVIKITADKNIPKLETFYKLKYLCIKNDII